MLNVTPMLESYLEKMPVRYYCYMHVSVEKWGWRVALILSRVIYLCLNIKISSPYRS